MTTPNVPLPNAGERTTPSEPAGGLVCDTCGREPVRATQYMCQRPPCPGHYAATHAKASIDPAPGFAEAHSESTYEAPVPPDPVPAQGIAGRAEDAGEWTPEIAQRLDGVVSDWYETAGPHEDSRFTDDIAAALREIARLHATQRPAAPLPELSAWLTAMRVLHLDGKPYDPISCSLCEHLDALPGIVAAAQHEAFVAGKEAYDEEYRQWKDDRRARD